MENIEKTERKFTDDEIVKALGCCGVDPKSGKYADCKNCPLDTIGNADCVHFVIQKNALDLINRQKAEREMLLKECKKCGSKTQKVITKLQKQIIQVKNEAIKEFAERLQAKAMLQHGGVTVVHGSDIDNLVKEMTKGGV